MKSSIYAILTFFLLMAALAMILSGEDHFGQAFLILAVYAKIGKETEGGRR